MQPDHTPFPPALFASVLGLSGVAGALHAASFMAPGLGFLSILLAWAAAASFFMLVALYVSDRMRHGGFAADWADATILPFFAALAMAVSVLASLAHGLPRSGALAMWSVAEAVLLLIGVRMLHLWVKGRWYEARNRPMTLLPFAGMLVTPATGSALGATEAAFVVYVFGAIAIMAVMPLVIRNLMTSPIAPNLRPTLLILMSPPALGNLGLIALGSPPGAAGPLMNLALASVLFLALFPVFISELARGQTLSIWALTFPVASLARGVMLLADQMESQWLAIYGLLVLGAATAAVGAAMVPAIRTLRVILAAKT